MYLIQVDNWKNLNCQKSFFKFKIYLFSTGAATTSKLDDSITVMHFQDFKYQYSKQYLNYKQIQWKYINDTFSGLHVPVPEPQTNPMMA